MLAHIPTACNSRWYVLGAGSVGCLWAARLARAAAAQERTMQQPQQQLQQQLPVLLLRTATHKLLGHPQQTTLRITDAYKCNSSWRATVGIDSIHDAHNPATQGSHHRIYNLLVTTKAYDAHAAISAVRHRLAEGARVLVLCNGMGVHEQLTGDTEMEGLQIFMGSSTHGSFKEHGDRFSIVHAGEGQVWVGPCPDCKQDVPRAAVEALADELDAATGLNVSAVANDEVLPPLWRKVAVNACINAAVTLAQRKNGTLAAGADADVILQAVCKEVAAVAAADGVRGIEAQALVTLARRVATQTADNINSMRQHVMHGQRTEIDYINGYVAARGRLHGIETPANSVLTALVHLLEARSGNEQ
eukprot:TRINITY_DN16307_c0_g1_i1.p1 TRINITY_DN16307_c0_g1~~TRINITY_DN16307_c0_g1_i1.p1  ORF type:complete len:360 (+),score=53.02 TRINITY_DN16307_c0_g1_i1:74-1153(+)